MEEKNIVSIDLGTSKLACCVASENCEGTMELLCYNEFRSKGINHGKVSNVNKLSDSLKSAIKDIERTLQIQVQKVVVNAQKYDIREIEVGAELEFGDSVTISENHIDTIKDSAVESCMGKVQGNEEILAIIEQNYDTDDEKNVSGKDIVGMMSCYLKGKYKAYICKSNGTRNMEAAFKSAGIELTKNSFCPDSVGESILNPAEIEGGVAVFDLGAGASSVSVFHNGSLRHYWALPFGGNDITGDIKNFFGLNDELAENIKMQYGCCMPDRLESLGEKTLRITDDDGNRKEFTAKSLSEVVTARCREIIEALLYDLQMSGYADKLKYGIVLCGGGARLMNICGLISDISGYRTRIASPSKSLFLGEENFYTCEAAVSAGLLRQMKDSDENSFQGTAIKIGASYPEPPAPEINVEKEEIKEKEQPDVTEPVEVKKVEKGKAKNSLISRFFGGKTEKEHVEVKGDKEPEPDIAEGNKPVKRVKKEKKNSDGPSLFDLDKLFRDDEDPDNNL